MSPKRGDRATVPPPDDEWDVRFGTTEAAVGWEELRTVWLIYASPRHPKDTDR